MEQFIPVIAIFIPVIALLIPIVAIFTSHQRKMAEMFHNGLNNQNTDLLNREIAMMREEISQLKASQNNLAIQVDDIKKSETQRSVTSQVAERLTNN